MSSYGYYNTLRRKNPYGSLGVAPGVAARVNRGLGRSATGAPPAPPPPPTDPFRDATASVAALLDGWLDQIRAEQQAAREQAQREAALELSKGQALAQGLQQLGISNAIQSIFQNAGASQAALAQGFSGQMQQQAAQQAAEQQRMLSGTGQEAAVRDQGVNMGNVQYGLGGVIPASTLNTQAANFAAEAALQPGFAQQLGQLAERQRMNQFVTDELPRFSQAIQDVIGKKPGLVRDALDEAWDRQLDLARLADKPATAAKTVLRTLANGQVGVFQNGKLVRTEGPAKADGAAATPRLQARTLSDGRVQWFDPTTGRPVGGPQGPARKTAKTDNGGRPYNLQLKTLPGGGKQWFDPRSGRPVGPVIRPPKVAPQASASQKRLAGEIAARAWNGVRVTVDGQTGREHMSYQEAMREALARGIPLATAQAALNQYWTKPGYDRDFANNSWVRSGKGRPLRSFQERHPGAAKTVPAADILPASWQGTHVTDGLGWGTKTAVDLFPGPPGTPVGSPVAGTVVYWHPDGAQGGGSMLIRGDDGYEYWVGHIDDGIRAGSRVERGSEIAVVSARHPRPHVHIDRRYVGRAA